jgi:hypothetical protein
MARVQVDQDVPQIGRPVGSREEIEAMGLPTRNIATCSAHQDRENMGCPVWRNCDREFRGKRPQNQPYQITKSGGEVRTTCGACFDVVALELQVEANGGLVEVIGKEGTTYLGRGSIKRHKKRDPDCDDCHNGKCNAYDDVEDLEFTCPKFPPASTHKELRKFARAIAAKNRGRQSRRQNIKDRLLGEDDPIEEKPSGRAAKS